MDQFSLLSKEQWSETWIPVYNQGAIIRINRIYNKILDRDWASARLIVT